METRLEENLEEQLQGALAALLAAEGHARDLVKHVDRMDRCVENLRVYARSIDGMPSRVEWDVIRETLDDAAAGILDE